MYAYYPVLGLWIRDLGPSCAKGTTFVGTDINPQFLPKEPSAAITFEVQDINKPWPEDWRRSFDVVHQRLVLAASGPAQQKAVHSLAELVKPGGWIQLIEGNNTPDETDGPAMKDFVQLIKDVFTIMGADPLFSHSMSRWLIEAGFTNVEERVLDTYNGPRNGDTELGKRGASSTLGAATGLVGFAKSTCSMPAGSKSLLSQVALPSLPSFSKEQINALVPRLKDELFERGGNYAIRLVWGRKPL